MQQLYIVIKNTYILTIVERERGGGERGGEGERGRGGGEREGRDGVG